MGSLRAQAVSMASQPHAKACNGSERTMLRWKHDHAVHAPLLGARLRGDIALVGAPAGAGFPPATFMRPSGPARPASVTRLAQLGRPVADFSDAFHKRFSRIGDDAQTGVQVLAPNERNERNERKHGLPRQKKGRFEARSPKMRRRLVALSPGVEQEPTKSKGFVLRSSVSSVSSCSHLLHPNAKKGLCSSRVESGSCVCCAVPFAM